MQIEHTKNCLSFPPPPKKKDAAMSKSKGILSSDPGMEGRAKEAVRKSVIVVIARDASSSGKVVVGLLTCGLHERSSVKQNSKKASPPICRTFLVEADTI